MCYVVETYVYINESRKEAFFKRINYVLSRKNGCAKKIDECHKTLNVSSEDFQNVIELLKQYNDLSSKLYSDLIYKNGEDL